MRQLHQFFSTGEKEYPHLKEEAVAQKKQDKDEHEKGLFSGEQ